MAVALDQPSFVVDLEPGVECEPQFLDGVEGADPQQLLLECANETLGTAVPLGRSHEGGRGEPPRDSRRLGQLSPATVAGVLCA